MNRRTKHKGKNDQTDEPTSKPTCKQNKSTKGQMIRQVNKGTFELRDKQTNKPINKQTDDRKGVRRGALSFVKKRR